jgi:dolichyl-phosphate beta-glucosyltransferase
MVVPCFNEAARWDADYWANMACLDNVDWVFVDDGSTDQTQEILTDFVQQQLKIGATVGLLSLQENAGKGEAIRQGWLSQPVEDYDSIGFIDADGAFQRIDVERILTEFDKHVVQSHFDAVWSSRVALAGRSIERQTSRHYIGRVVATFLSLGGHSIPYDTQSGLKLFAANATLWESLNSPFETRWLFEIEMVAKYQRISGQELRIWEMPLDFWEDVAGSKIGFGESLRIIRELIKVKGVQKSSR